MKRLTHARFSLLAVIALLAGCTSAGLPRLPFTLGRTAIEKRASVEGVTEYRLPNGFRALLLPDSSDGTVTVNITYLVGSGHEGYGESGIAHLLEHLLCEATRHHPDIDSEMEARGAEFNAGTTQDYTQYYEIVSAGVDDLRWALDLEADRMVNAVLTEDALATEVTVVRNELENDDNDPGHVLLDRLRSAAYLWHNYGKAIVGARSDLESITLRQVRDFYRTWYRPDNAVLVVAGTFDETAILGRIQDAFGRIPLPAQPLPTRPTVEPTQDGERSIVLRMAGDTPHVVAAWHVPAASHPDAAALGMLAQMLEDEPSGTLYTSLVKSGIAAEVGAGMSFRREPGLFVATATLRADRSVDHARDRLIALIESTGSVPPPSDHLERIRKRMLAAYELAMNDAGGLGFELSDWFAAGDWRLFFLYRDRVRSVTQEDVQRVAQTYLLPSNRTVAVFIPTEEPPRAEIPPAPDVRTLLAGYVGGAGPASGESLDADLLALEPRTIRKLLWDDVELAMIRKKTRGDMIFFRMSVDFGDEATLEGWTLAAELCGGLLMGGTTKHTRQELHDRLDQLKAILSVDGGPTEANISLEVPKKHFADALRLAAEILRQPAFSEEYFNIYRERLLQEVEASRSDPSSLASTALTRHLYNWPARDTRHVYTADELIDGIKSLTVDDVRRFHEEFYGVSHAQVAVVGDLAGEDVEALVKSVFEGWKSPKPYTPIVSPYRVVTPLRATLETPDKTGAVLHAAMLVDMTEDDPDYPALAIGVYLAGGSPSSRLWKRIRGRDGLSYDVSADLDVNELSRDSLFTVSVTYPPDKAAEVETAIQQELSHVLDDGFTEAELAEAKEALLQRMHLYLTQDDAMADHLLRQAWVDETFHDDVDLEARVHALTRAEVQAAMKKHLHLERLSVVKAGNFSATRVSLLKTLSGAGSLAGDVPMVPFGARAGVPVGQ